MTFSLPSQSCLLKLPNSQGKTRFERVSIVDFTLRSLGDAPIINITTNMRVPNSFFGIRDLAYFKAGIRGFEGKGGRDSGL